jgi:hypothetical protein
MALLQKIEFLLKRLKILIKSKFNIINLFTNRETWQKKEDQDPKFSKWLQG